MSFHYCIPGRDLRAYIERYWLTTSAPAVPRLRILPSGTMELAINLSDDVVRMYAGPQMTECLRFSGAVVSGAFRGFFALDPMAHATVIGVHFRPGGATRFLNLPASELTDAHVDLDAIWGPSARELRDRLIEAGSVDARFRVLEGALLDRLRASSERRAAVGDALSAFEGARGAVRVRDVARRVGLSQRRFIQVFAADVGLTPKIFGRVCRFQRAREVVQGVAAPDWAAVAAECGYFDQSHLIRDFVEFAGTSPEAYMRELGEPVLPVYASPAGTQ